MRHLWLLALAALCWLSSSAHATDATSRPNIILCMTDDQGWGDVSYNGLQKIKTPHLDAMAANGLRFNRFYSAAPNCSPTRGSVLTGRHPNRYGTFSHGYPLRPQEHSIAMAVKPAGYATGHFGKWHLNGVRGAGQTIAATDPLHPGKFGFDQWLSVSNFFDLDWTLSRNGVDEKFVGDGSDYIVAEAMKFIKTSHNQQQPFLTVIWFGNPHSPHRALPDDLKAAGGSAYYGEIVAIDRAMGRLRNELRTMGIADNTLLWFCSDNGATGPGSTGGLRGKKGSLWEGGVRVPGIIEWPARIRKPATTDVPAVTSDIYPTVVDALNLKVEQVVKPLDGISLLPLIDGTMKHRPAPIGFWFFLGGKDITKESSAAALSDNRYKLHRLVEGKYELYDLAGDPNETTEISAAQPEVLQSMKTALDVWQDSVIRSYRGGDYPPGTLVKPLLTNPEDSTKDSSSKQKSGKKKRAEKKKAT